MNRRNFSKLTALTSLIGFAPGQLMSCTTEPTTDLKISLAQWSLNKAIRAGKLSPLDFAKKSRSFGIDAIEYVSGLYTHHSNVLDSMSMEELSKELLKRSNDYGIENVWIMIDAQGKLASSNKKENESAIENHKKWIDFALSLGCETLRLNLSGENDLDKWTANSVESLTRLSNYNKNINIVVTVCDNANKVCPIFPGKVERIHWSIKDPFKGWNSQPDDLVNFRKTREDLTARIKNLIKSRFA